MDQYLITLLKAQLTTFSFFIKGSWYFIKGISKILFVLLWSIWGLLGALPGGNVLKAAIAITLLYTTGIVHLIAFMVGADITIVDTAINGIGNTIDRIKIW